jgi:2-keto-4-pentenoate hydratase
MTKSASQLLAEVRTTRVRLPELPAAVRPATPEAAYRCQDQVTQDLLGHYGGEVAGYKIACTNVTAQRQLHVDGPFYGRLLSSFCYDSPARVDPRQFFMRVIEAEFGFRFARDLPPASTPRSRDEIAAALEGVLPSIEIVDSRYESWTTIGAPSLIADNACHAAWVRGLVLKSWQEIDLAAQPVQVVVNGNVIRRGSGRAVLGHPLNALQWLVNTLASRGLGLKAGQYVTTGVTSEIYMAEPGDRITADFGPVGPAEMVFG